MTSRSVLDSVRPSTETIFEEKFNRKQQTAPLIDNVTQEFLNKFVAVKAWHHFTIHALLISSDCCSDRQCHLFF